MKLKPPANHRVNESLSHQFVWLSGSFSNKTHCVSLNEMQSSSAVTLFEIIFWTK